MERKIAVYNCDGELLQWIDPQRVLRLVDMGRVARVVKTRTGRVRGVSRITLVRIARRVEAVTALGLQGNEKYSFRQHLDDGRCCYRLRALGDNRNDEDYWTTSSHWTRCGRSSYASYSNCLAVA
jgi:hypothetical protein